MQLGLPAEELLRGLADGGDARQVKPEKKRFFACVGLQLRYGSLGLGPVSRGDVDFRVVLQEDL